MKVVPQPAELTALHYLARAYVFTASGSPSNIESVRAELAYTASYPVYTTPPIAPSYPSRAVYDRLEFF